MSVEFAKLKSPSLFTPSNVFQNVTVGTMNKVQKKKSINILRAKGILWLKCT